MKVKMRMSMPGSLTDLKSRHHHHHRYHHNHHHHHHQNCVDKNKGKQHWMFSFIATIPLEEIRTKKNLEQQQQQQNPSFS